MSRPSIPLGRRLLAAIFGITALCLATSVIITSFSIISTKKDEAWRYLESTAQLLSGTLSAPLDFADIETARSDLAALALQPNMEYGLILDVDKAPVAQWGEAPDGFAATSLCGVARKQDAHRLVICKEILADSRPVGSLLLSYSLKEMWASVREYLLFSMGAALVSFFFCLFLAFRLRSHTLRPLLNLSGATRDIATRKDYSLRVPQHSDDELGELVQQFNTMLDEIEKRDERLTAHQRTLENTVQERTEELSVKNVMLEKEVAERQRAEMIREEVERINRHDMKSILNLIIGYPELLLQQGDLTDRQKGHLKKIEAAGYRMLEMINNHLDIFKMEKGIYTLKPMPIDLIELLCRLEEDLLPVLTRKQVAVSVTLNGNSVGGMETVLISAEYNLLTTLFSNLITNAIEASSMGDVITIAIDEEAQRISIHNPTPVPEPIRDRFFDKYVTCGKEDGTGLGTYSVWLIAKAHGERLDMVTGEEVGTTVTMSYSLPTAETLESGASLGSTIPQWPPKN